LDVLKPTNHIVFRFIAILKRENIFLFGQGKKKLGCQAVGGFMFRENQK
jgi:hypothetical protein